MKTYSLAEVIHILGLDELKNPERWLRERLNNGTLRGSRIGRGWVMTDRQLEYNLEVALSNADKATPATGVNQDQQDEPVSILDGMSEIARRRIQRQADRRLA